MSRKHTKNISKNVPNGTIIHTRDEFFLGQSNYRKPGYEDKGLYRKTVVVDSNRMDELALVKLGTSSGKTLTNYKNGKSKYKPIVLTRDSNNNPIKIGHYFVRKSRANDMSLHDVNKIKKDLFRGKNKSSNRRRLRELKGRQ